MSASYSGFAYIYDKLMQDADYDRWVTYIEEILRKYNIKPELMLDLACGTGSICTRLAQKGHDMIGIDLSEDMLNVAMGKAKEQGLDILFLNQDMREFELYGTVDVITCLMDSINYLTDEQDLQDVFSLVNNYLNPGGLFIFDINSAFKLKEILGSNTFVVEENDIFYVWENNFREDEEICDFYLTFFIKNGYNYSRVDEIHYEKAYSEDTITRYLEKAGLKILGVFDQFEFEKPGKNSERIFFVAQRIR